jgi:subfamily B ATP-binding cassette protein MsbA
MLSYAQTSRPGEIDGPIPSYSTLDLLRIGRRFGLRYRHIGLILIMSAAGTAIEGLSLLLVLPIVDILQKGGDVSLVTERGFIWTLIESTFNVVGLQVSLGALLVMMFIGIILRQVVRYTVTLYIDYVELLIVQGFRTQAFSDLLNASLDFYDQRKSGNIVSDLTGELPYAVRGFLNNVRLLSLLAMMILYGVGAVAISPEMTGIAFAVFALVGFVLRGLLRRQEVLSSAMTSANQSISSTIVDSIRAIRLVRLSGAEDEERKAFTKRLHNQFSVHFSGRKIGAFLVNVVEPLILGAALCILYLGVTYFEVKISSLFLLLLIVLRLLPVFRDIMVSQQTIKSSSGSIIAVVRLKDALGEGRDTVGGSRPLQTMTKGLTFERVEFSYLSRVTPALNAVSFSVPAGRMTALIGPSGSGKSTLVDLIPRLRVPEGGRILRDGVDIAEFDLKALRRSVAFVPQSAIVLDGTIGSHIRCGNGDATDADVRQAARLAGADKFIELLPKGYDTRTGEAGLQLSGGQRQRLDLARALARRAEILILDEPTANLDPELERHFKDVLNELRRTTGLTIIVIAHRLSTIRDADQIVLLREGVVEAIGTHDELVATNDWYKSASGDQFNAI